MDKLLSLLNEVTIIDLRMLYQITLRYKIHFLFAAGFFLTFCTYYFYSQPIIYSVSMPIKVVTTLKVSNDLSALLPIDNANTLTLEELTITLSNNSFISRFAALTIESPVFDQMNFGSTKSRQSLFGSELRRVCKTENDCILERLAPALKELYMIEQGLTENRFILITSAIEKNTARTLSVILAHAIEMDRISVRQYTVLKEIKSVGSLIDESRSVMLAMGGYKALDDQERLNNNILDLKERIRMLQESTSLEVANATSLQAKLLQNKKTIKRIGISKDGYDGYVKVQARLNEIKLNIANLTSLPEKDRTMTDKSIIAQLKAERSRLLAVIPAEHQLNTMVLDESFKDKQRENFGSYEFEYSVSKNKLAKLNEEYEASKLELNGMMQEKLINESKVNGMKADLEFLKSLESKQMSLKLLNATMNADLIFEEGNQLIKEFRSSSFSKTFLFSFAITAFLYLISILIRFSADDKIYGKEEVLMHFKKLDFIGEVPSFE